jgi:hypothetical protein
MVFLEANKLSIKIMFRVARFKKCFDVNRKEENESQHNYTNVLNLRVQGRNK